MSESVFPNELQPFTRVGRDGTFYRTEGGLALRDYFAAKAMATFLRDAVLPTKEIRDEQLSFVACIAYEAADAMLSARDGR